MWAWIRNTLGFLQRHRGRIAITAIIAIVVAIYLQNFPMFQGRRRAEEDGTLDDYDNRRRISQSEANRQTNARLGHRSRLLIRVRRQFDASSKQFLPILRRKIVEQIDINHTVQQIKELRSTGGITNNNIAQAEALLWDEVKVSTFTLLIVSIYMLAGLCSLLRIQLHVLARYLLNHSLDLAGSDGSQNTLDTDMFRILTNGTYKQLFGSGLTYLTMIVRDHVTNTLKTWHVSGKLKIEYHELITCFILLRKHIEADLPHLIKIVFLGGGEEGNGSANVRLESVIAQQLLEETWEVVQSPSFVNIYLECLDNAFQFVEDTLRYQLFLPDNTPSTPVTPVQPSIPSITTPTKPSAGSTQSPFQTPEKDTTTATAIETHFSLHRAWKTPPLASLLPQLKSIAQRLFPDDPRTNSTATNSHLNSNHSSWNADIKHIATGPLMESFCIGILDALPLPSTGGYSSATASAGAF